MELRGWAEIGPDGGVLLTPYVPQRIIGIDYDDYDDDVDGDLCDKLITRSGTPAGCSCICVCSKNIKKQASQARIGLLCQRK